MAPILYVFVIAVAVLANICECNIIRRQTLKENRPAEVACSHYKNLRNQLFVPEKNVQELSGEQDSEFEYPHMAALGWQNQNGGDYQYLCGGTIVSSRFVLTAAHCTHANYHKTRGLTRPAPAVVKLGSRDLLKPSQMVEIERILVHEKYSAPKKYYDIALIELETAIQFGRAVMPACLWTGEADREAVAVATGWGAIKSGRTVRQEPTRALHAATIQLVSPSACDDSLANHNWSRGTASHQLCAGGMDGHDTCGGDSGSPLQIKRAGESVSRIVGITSFGSKSCGRHPAVYTKVSHFAEWIEAIVWPEDAAA